METATSERATRPNRPLEMRPSSLSINTGLAIENALTMLESKDLPLYEKIEEVTDLIRNNDRLIVEAETGSGKSTLTPVIALAELHSRNPHGRVAVTQPRRIAAENLYRYLEPEMGSRVGFKHGGKSNVTNDTQLEFTIERSLLNQMIRDNDPLLMRYDTIILDEVHERRVDLEILMPLLKQAQDARATMGKPLKVILTSATMDKEKMMAYQEGAVHVQVEGRMFDVTEFYEDKKIDPQDVMVRAAQVASAVHSKGDDEPGDILIFMPGQQEIERTIEALKKQPNLKEEDIEIIPLIGGGESAESAEKIHQDSSKKRIYVATNVAETSITIPKVRVVIDSGLMRIDSFNPETGISGLETVEHTKSNAKQRKGRAGRTATGTVHYLFTKEEMEAREPYLKPEILRTDLAAQILLMKQLGISNISNFDFLDHPGKDKINKALKTLKTIGALNSDGSLSDIGREMTKINAEPRFARMIVEARKHGVEKEVALVIGMIQNARYDVFRVNTKEGETLRSKYGKFIIPGSDILTRLNVWNEYIKHKKTKEERKTWEEETGIRTRGLFNASSARKEILNDRSIKDDPVDLSPGNAEKITRCIASGLIENLITRNGSSYETDSGISVRIDNRGSVLSGTIPEKFISSVIRRTSGGNFAGFNIEITPQIVNEFAPVIPDTKQSQEAVRATEINTNEKVEGEASSLAAKAADNSSQAIVNETHHQSSLAQKSEEIAKKSRIQKVREWVRNWLKKLRIVR